VCRPGGLGFPLIRSQRKERKRRGDGTSRRRIAKAPSRSLRFVDLFAGLGGFHVALARLGHRCVLAAETDKELQRVYKLNFGLIPQGDVRDIKPTDIPPHDVLCAGFPCQPYSKAGAQLGADCPVYGDLASQIVDWLRVARPHHFILENVPNLLRHRRGDLWRHLSTDLRQVGYDIRHAILSPHNFGVPQVRERLYIVGSQQSLAKFKWPQSTGVETHIRSVLDANPVGARRLAPKAIAAIDVWAAFIERFPQNQPKPYFPIWAAEFGATYPFATTTPAALGATKLREYRGRLGVQLSSLRGKALFEALPTYSRANTRRFPPWKVRFIQQNRDLYMRNRGWIDPWKGSLTPFGHSFQKLEWHCDRSTTSLWDSVIQLRGSGIRAKSPSAAPSLVANVDTQTPVIGWERRFMTVTECARLQGLNCLAHLPTSNGAALRALGNAVNVTVTELIAQRLLQAHAEMVIPTTGRRARA
jgi:DNA (cytosine-5)-methyltransferase 1